MLFRARRSLGKLLHKSIPSTAEGESIYSTEYKISQISKFTGLRKIGISILLAIPLCIFVITGVRGIDYGEHWDEFKQILLVRQAINKGIILPGWYHYPSATYWLSLSTITPYVIGTAKSANYEWKPIYDYLKGTVLRGKIFHLQVRKVFLVVSAVTLIWVFLLTLAWGRPWYEALLASSILGFSWEINYHARWIAPDTILMQFGTLTILLSALAVERTGQRLWLWLAAVVAGISAGTKYPAGLLLIPVLIAAYQSRSKTTTAPKFLGVVVGVGVLFISGYLLSTPGTILETQAFIEDVRYEIDHYQTGHYGLIINPGLEHLSRIGIYFSLVLFSNYFWIALSFFILTVLGSVIFLKETPGRGILFMSFPLAYCLYFSTLSVMIARNYLVIAPFLALMAARGTTFVWDMVRPMSLRVLWGIFVLGLLITNAAWLFYAAETIQDRGTDRFLNEFARYVENHPEVQFLVTDEISEQISNLGNPLPTNISTVPNSNVDAVAFYTTRKLLYNLKWPISLPNPDVKRFGPLEVNMDYYPSWIGDRRIIVMSVEEAQEVGYPLSSR